MPRNLSRHEQFLRIFALLEILSNSRQPLDDQSLIAALKERLGLSKLSPRTLHRDCTFLVTCGYPVDHLPLAGDRKYGWLMQKDAAGRKIPAEPLTVLELVAFTVGRDLLRTFEGTILWSGIESLRHKIERSVPPELLKQLEQAKQAFHVPGFEPARYASRPRLLSALSAAITDCHEIDVEERPQDGKPASRLRVRPLRLVIHPPKVQLLGLMADASGQDQPLVLDIDHLEKITPLDVTFTPPPIDVEAILAAHSRRD